MNRRGVFTAELAVGVLLAGALGALAVQGVRERLGAARAEERAADLEVAQNLLDTCRAGGEPVLPPGWRLERVPAGPGVLAVSVHGPHLHLATLCAEARP